MGYYPLTESYSNLYNPRFAQENASFYDNLKFVDYLLDEHIQEVMEGLLWEFVDYGNTIEESNDIIKAIFSEPILEEVILDTQQYYLGEGLGSFAAKGARKLAGKAERYASDIEKQGGRQATMSRLTNRASRVLSNLNRAKKAITDPISQTATAAYKGSTKAAADTGRYASKKTGEAKSALSRMVRQGSKSVLSGAGKLARNIGRGIERRAAASQTVDIYDPRSRSSAPVGQYRKSAPGSTTGERIGRAIRSAGAGLSRASRNFVNTQANRTTPTPTPTRTRSGSEDPRNQPFTPRPRSQSTVVSQPRQNLSPPGRTAPAAPMLPAAGGTSAPKPPIQSAGQRRAAQRAVLASRREQEQRNKETAMRRGRAQLKGSRAATGSQFTEKGYRSTEALPPKGGTSRTSSGALRPEQSRRSALQRASKGESSLTQVLSNYDRIHSRAKARGIQEESFDLILNLITEDIINNGYANNYDDAINIIEGFSNETLYDLIETYDNQF